MRKLKEMPKRVRVSYHLSRISLAITYVLLLALIISAVFKFFALSLIIILLMGVSYGSAFYHNLKTK